MLSNVNNQAFIKNLLQKNLRLDGRQNFQCRNIDAGFTNKNGSLLYALGKTEVMVKTNIQIVMPKPQKPAQGFIFFRVNCLACPYNFQQNKKNSTEITKLLEKVIIGSNCLDPESLSILTGKFVWQLTVDCIIVRDEGNIIDAVLNGVVLALMDVRKPILNIQKSKVELTNKMLPLSIAHLPISLSFGLLDNSIVLDPTIQQQVNLEGKITISMNVYEQICSIHKPGGKAVAENIILGMIKVCAKQVKQKTKLMRQILQKRNSVMNTF